MNKKMMSFQLLLFILILTTKSLYGSPVIIASSCLKMVNGDPDQCQECNQDFGYYLYIKSPNKTQCAKKVSQTQCELDILNYPPKDDNPMESVKLYFVDMGSKFKSYCFRWELYKMISQTENICGNENPQGLFFITIVIQDDDYPLKRTLNERYCN